MALARCLYILLACLAFATASLAQPEPDPVPDDFIPDHYVWYNLSKPKPCGQNIRPQLVDQFLDREFKVLNLIGLLNPVFKEHGEATTGVTDLNLHYSVYGITGRRFSKSSPTLVRTQFGELLLKKIGDPKLLFVPAAFDLTQKPTAPAIGANDHYLCYGVTVAPNQQQPRADIILEDPLGNPDAARDFVDFESYSLLRTGLKYLCNPADKNDEGAPHIDAANNHLACFALNNKKRVAKGKIADQFISTAVSLNKESFLCVPAQKILCGPENTDELCADGIDNDCDGIADCEDPSCLGTNCSCRVDGELVLPDRGGDEKFGGGSTIGATNDFDPACAESDGAGDLAFSWTPESSGYFHFVVQGEFQSVLTVLDSDCTTSLGCNDGFNNAIPFPLVPCVPLNAGQTIFAVVDGIGTSEGSFVLAAIPSFPSETNCEDGVDDDCDGQVDCDDPDCSISCAGATCAGRCGNFDFPCACDRLCESFGDCCPDVNTQCEITPTACIDGIDNNGNSNIDCQTGNEEPTCNCGPENFFGNCVDGIDNDNDGSVDCDDGDCAGVLDACPP